MKVLPNADNAIIPIQKFTEYALHPINSRGKLIAFEQALGYNLTNVNKLIENIKVNIKNFEAVSKDDNGFGQKYEVIMTLLGENGKTANVLTAWIIEHNKKAPRLTTAYIKTRRTKDD